MGAGEAEELGVRCAQQRDSDSFHRYTTQGSVCIPFFPVNSLPTDATRSDRNGASQSRVGLGACCKQGLVKGWVMDMETASCLDNEGTTPFALCSCTGN